MKVNKRSKLVIAKVAVCLAVLTCIALYAQNHEFFAIKTVKVSGQFTHVSKKSIRGMVLPYIDKGLFTLSTKEISHKLKEKTWVSEADVKRSWPDILSVVIKERTVFARWGDKGLIDSKGKMFFPSSMDGFESYHWPPCLGRGRRTWPRPRRVRYGSLSRIW